MQVRDSFYQYPGLGTPTIGVAHLRVYSHDDAVVAVVGQLTDNPSTPVAERIDVIVAQLVCRYGPRVIVVEHLPPADRDTASGQWCTVVGTQVPGPLDGRRRRISVSDVEMLAGEPITVWSRGDYLMERLLVTGTSLPF